MYGRFVGKLGDESHVLGMYVHVHAMGNKLNSFVFSFIAFYEIN